MKRTVSFSEVATLLDCQAKHDFAYVGKLAGSALKRREAHVRLREGRAWGRAVVALHGWDAALGSSWDPEAPASARYGRALDALHRALDEDAAQLQAAGVYDQAAHHDLGLHLEAVLWHYAYSTEPLVIERPELELLVPIPSRASSRASSRYVFHGFLDGLTRLDGRLWIVEYKLRGRLTGTAQVQLGRQYRFYAWAAERVLEEPVAGVLVDERLNEAPKPPRRLKSGFPSHAKDQLTTREQYQALCEELDVEPEVLTMEALDARRWQRREPVLFSRSELGDVPDELRSAAHLLQLYDAGELYPLRNPSPMRCPGCPFLDICAHPRDRELVDALYDRIPAKRDREEAAA